MDLVISDLLPRSVEVMHTISDHNMVWACFDIGIPESSLVIRKVFDYAMADCASIKQDIAAFDWRYIDRESVDDAERFLRNNLFSIFRIHIPERTLHERKSAHPWVNKPWLLAIRPKTHPKGPMSLLQQLLPTAPHC